MAKIRQFPFEHESKKELLFYPPTNPFSNGDILEIGPGRGDLILDLAEKQPDKKFVAVELGTRRFYKLIPRIEKKNLTNIRMIRGDARLVLPHYFEPSSFETIFVLFPDPWPKAKHSYKRLLSIEFLWILTHQLKMNGSLILGTDDQPYYEWSRDNLQHIHVLQNALTPHWSLDKLPEFKTTFFEKKWRDQGKNIFFQKYTKIK